VLASWCAGSALKRPRESVPATPAPAVHDPHAKRRVRHCVAPLPARPRPVRPEATNSFLGVDNVPRPPSRCISPPVCSQSLTPPVAVAGIRGFRRLNSVCHNPYSGKGERTHQERRLHTLATSPTEDPDRALIVGIWGRLANEIMQCRAESWFLLTPPGRQSTCYEMLHIPRVGVNEAFRFPRTVLYLERE
jgi:hypothetical protein